MVSKRTAQIVITVLACLFIAGALALYWRNPPDFAYNYLPATQRWLSGQTWLYDAASPGFLNAPWMLGFIIPFSALPIAIGQIALYLLSLVCIWLSIAVFWDRQHFSGAVLAVASLPVLFLLNNGQIEGVMLLGITVSYLAILKHHPGWLSVGLVVLLIKPLNALLPLLLFAWAVRHWRKREWLAIISLPLVALVLSFVMAGLDWPLRYWEVARESQSVALRAIYVTIWRGAEYLNVPIELPVVGMLIALLGWIWQVWRTGFTLTTLSLALATNLTFTYYALEYHHVLLIPAFLLVARSRLVAWIAYLTTFAAFMRLTGGWTLSWVIVAYPLTLLIMVWLTIWRQSATNTRTREREASGYA